MLPREDKQRRAPLKLLIGLLAANLLLMSVTARSSDGSEQFVLRTWALAVVTPVQSLLAWALGGVESLWSDYIDLRSVRERNQVLEKENAELRYELGASRAAAIENERLRRELELKPLLKYDTVSAWVISRDANAWFRRLVIDKGTLAGVQLNQPVVSAEGLVGRVIAVGPNAATVQLITDEHAGVGGRLESSRAHGEVEGRGDGLCRFKSVSSIQTVEPGEAVFTSGLDRIYPPGVLVGYVDAVAPGSGASTLDIAVRPGAPLDRLEDVLVLVVEPADVSTPSGVRP
jgi:rod shape-determining protein MreC